MTKLSLPGSYSYKSYYIDIYKILKVEQFENLQYDVDYALKFSITKKEDLSSENFLVLEFSMFGKLFKNGNFPVNISYLLTACGFASLSEEEQNKIIDEILNKNLIVKQNLNDFFINKEIKLLKYVYRIDENGFPKYKFWKGNVGFDCRKNIFSVNTSDKKIYEEFMKKVNDPNYPIADYLPELLKENLVDEEDDFLC